MRTMRTGLLVIGQHQGRSGPDAGAAFEIEAGDGLLIYFQIGQVDSALVVKACSAGTVLTGL